MSDKIRVKEHDRKLPEKKQTKTKVEPVTRQPTQGVTRVSQNQPPVAPSTRIEKGVTIVGGGPGNPKEKGVEIHSARRQ